MKKPWWKTKTGEENNSTTNNKKIETNEITGNDTIEE